MENQWRPLLVALHGDHGYDRVTRIQGWLPIWIALILMILSAKDSLLGANRSISPYYAVGALALVAAFLWVRAFNRTRYHIGNDTFQCLAPWPRRSWRLGVEDVRSIRYLPSRAGWILALRLHAGRSRKILLTRSMSKALDLK
jgi:hypothetical protein